MEAESSSVPIGYELGVQKSSQHWGELLEVSMIHEIKTQTRNIAIFQTSVAKSAGSMFGVSHKCLLGLIIC